MSGISLLIWELWGLEFNSTHICQCSGIFKIFPSSYFKKLVTTWWPPIIVGIYFDIGVFPFIILEFSQSKMLIFRYKGIPWALVTLPLELGRKFLLYPIPLIFFMVGKIWKNFYQAVFLGIQVRFVTVISKNDGWCSEMHTL